LRISSFLHRNWRSLFILCTIVADLGAIIIASALAALAIDLVPSMPRVSMPFYFFFTWFSTLVLVGSGLFLGLYRSSFHSNKAQQNRLAGRTYFYSFLLILASFTVFKVTDYQR
jgi:hypothetical protein